MVAPASYGWNKALDEAVPDGGTVVVQAHDLSDQVDQDSVDVALDGEVLRDEEYTTSFDVAGKTVTVTNNTGDEWSEQSNLYVSAHRKPLGSGAGDGGAALEARIVELETQVADHENRITALQDQVATHETRIAALETPARR